MLQPLQKYTLASYLTFALGQKDTPQGIKQVAEHARDTIWTSKGYDVIRNQLKKQSTDIENQSPPTAEVCATVEAHVQSPMQQYHKYQSSRIRDRSVVAAFYSSVE